MSSTMSVTGSREAFGASLIELNFLPPCSFVFGWSCGLSGALDLGGCIDGECLGFMLMSGGCDSLTPGI